MVWFCWLRMSSNSSWINHLIIITSFKRKSNSIIIKNTDLQIIISLFQSIVIFNARLMGRSLLFKFFFQTGFGSQDCDIFFLWSRINKVLFGHIRKQFFHQGVQGNWPKWRNILLNSDPPPFCFQNHFFTYFQHFPSLVPFPLSFQPSPLRDEHSHSLARK